MFAIFFLSLCIYFSFRFYVSNFKTIIALIIDGQVNYFEGVCSGKITLAKDGKQGFGYDPIFKDWDLCFDNPECLKGTFPQEVAGKSGKRDLVEAS